MSSRRLLANPLLRSSFSRSLQHTARRSLQQPPRHASTVHPQTNTPVHPISRTARPETYLHRTANRALPPLSSIAPSTRTWALTIPVFLAVLTASALGIFNYQKASSPIIASTLYALRTSPTARAVLGDEVYFASKWAWVWGHINLVQGRVDVQFKVKGTRRQGMCRFRARRVGGRSGMFETSEWSLTMDDTGEVIQLLDSSAPDPLANTKA